MSKKENLKAQTIDALLSFHGLPDYLLQAVIPALKDERTVIDVDMLPDFLRELFKDAVARQALLTYLKILASTGKYDKTSLEILRKNAKFEQLVQEHILSNPSEKDKPRHRSRR